jgi:sugar lactone lactonase YvrE
LAIRDGFFVQAEGGPLSQLAETEMTIRDNRMNDGKCDPAGRFWAGTMNLDAKVGAGALYRLDVDHSVTRVLSDVTISNGLGWSPAGDHMYYIDTWLGGIDEFDFDAGTGECSNRRRLVDIPKDLGVPDGMAVDSDGYLWVALCYGWAVHRYSPSGKLDAVVRFPCSLITSCAFGGRDLGELYVTSGTLNLTPEQLREQPYAGALFLIRPGVAGLPPNVYRG